MDSDFVILTEEMVTINELVYTAARRKNIIIEHVDGPLGVRGRNSNNDLIREKLGWDYSQTLEDGIEKTYNGLIHLLKLQKKLNLSKKLSRFLKWTL